MKTTITVQSLVEQAIREVTNLTLAEFKQQIQLPDTLIIDIRDIRELKKLGKIPNAIHMPRGMLEFWFDAESEYYKADKLKDAKRAILYCAASWRSALAAKTLQDMGVENITHLEDGFNGWVAAGEPVEQLNPDK